MRAVARLGRFSILVAVLALVVLAGAQQTGAAQSSGPPAPGAAAKNPVVPGAVARVASADITRAVLEAPIRFLSSDLLEGRGPATRGDQITRLYLQTRLEGMGYKPAFPNGEWQQPFDIAGIRSQMPQIWSFQGKNERADLAWRRDYIATSGEQSERVSVNDAELVFVGSAPGTTRSIPPFLPDALPRTSTSTAATSSAAHAK
jgi:hypothetical protein